MKKITVIFMLLTGVYLLVFLTGCAEEDSGMSIDERIEEFVSELNDTTRNSLKDHFHSDCAASSSSEAYWETKFANDSGQTYSQGAITSTGSTTRDVKIIGGLYDATDTFSFTMKEEDEDDWYILDIDLNSSDFVP